jgi:putative SOS response-associated peptidase YedK
MCGRFTQHYTWREIQELYGLVGAARNVEPRYNIAPTDRIDVVVQRDGGRELVPMRWGLIPWWWKKALKDLPSTFNARAETVADKPMFRDAFKRGRCIVPASGYYEWRATAAGKQPYYITASDGAPLSIAGLWDTWKAPENGADRVLSCTMIVTAANAFTRGIHDRMPVLLDKADVGPWLSGAGGADLLKPAADTALRMWPVSRRVNRSGSGSDDRALIDEVAA